MQEFFTRQVANEGVSLPLYHPDGTKSKHWLKVRGIDSDHFRQAEAAAKRKAVDISQLENEEERAKAIREAELCCIAALIADWSFDQACTEKNVVDFLREAPQIADTVNRFAARRNEFFAKKPETSLTGQKPNSTSKSRKKAQKPASDAI